MLSEEDIVSKLQDNGYETYLVGGCVRDMLLGVECKDKDVTTSATPDEISEIFKSEKIKNVGKSFLVTFVNGIEVATFRSDSYSGLDDKNVNIKKADSAKEDVMRRDFTINSLLYDPISKKIIDHVNGQDDLQKKIIKFNGKPEDRIWEDPNRIIRACRFLAKIEGSFDKDTFDALFKFSSYIEKYVKPERIRLEIIKAMSSVKKSSIFFETLNDIEALKYIFPSLKNSYLHNGGPYHIEYVFDHCLLAGDHCSTRFPLIKLAAYLHDVGKPISSRINPHTGDIWFEGHEKTGAEAAKKELEKLKFSNDEVNLISNLISLHMRISGERLGPKGVRRTLKSLSDFGIRYKDLLRLSVCDKMGNLKSRKKYKFDDVVKLSKAFRDQIYIKNPINKFSDLKVNGFDVMEATGLKPGKEVGDILEKLFDLVIEEPELNERDKLIELIKDMIGENYV